MRITWKGAIGNLNKMVGRKEKEVSFAIHNVFWVGKWRVFPPIMFALSNCTFRIFWKWGVRRKRVCQLSKMVSLFVLSKPEISTKTSGTGESNAEPWPAPTTPASGGRRRRGVNLGSDVLGLIMTGKKTFKVIRKPFFLRGLKFPFGLKFSRGPKLPRRTEWQQNLRKEGARIKIVSILSYLNKKTERIILICFLYKKLTSFIKSHYVTRNFFWVPESRLGSFEPTTCSMLKI